MNAKRSIAFARPVVGLVQRWIATGIVVFGTILAGVHPAAAQNENETVGFQSNHL